MKSIKKLEKESITIQNEILELDTFRDTAFLRKFKRHLHGELSTIKARIKRKTETKQEQERRKSEKNKIANKNRSTKNKRVWKYVKSIQENYYPDKSLKEIRSQLKKYKTGLENDISDVAWRNPSP